MIRRASKRILKGVDSITPLESLAAVMRGLLTAAALAFLLGSVHAQEIKPRAEAAELHARPLAAPATPLVACDPYFSIWSPADRLSDADTVHWTGKPHRLTSLASIDGKLYRLMGTEPTSAPALEQTGVTITPTQTVYEFSGHGVQLRVAFTTPALPEDVDLLSRPITYVTYRAQSGDGKQHEVRLLFQASAELTVNVPGQAVAGNLEAIKGLSAVRLGSQEQAVLRRKGDDLRIDWGYLYLAANSSDGAPMLGEPAKLLDEFAAAGNGAPAAPQTPIETDSATELSGAIAFDLPEVGSEAVERWLVLAYDDLYSIEYMHRPLRPYWRRNGLDAAGLLTEAARDYAAIIKRCDDFDAELGHDLLEAGGEEYAAIATLAYRQCFAAGKFVADANGQPLQFSKENHSNGCIATSDVFYPMAPQFLLYGPSLTKSFLEPFMNYAASERWKFPFAPHDLGTYPQANGQVYGGGEKSEENQMPVEESGNLLLLMAALAQMEGNADYASQYWPQLSAWAEYLKQQGFDPPNQLCTDDFAGHLAHNVNLSAKAICALGAYAQLCEMRGDDEAAAAYRKVAEEYAARWVQEADDGDHFRLTFDRSGTWSQKYNLVWDKLLGLKLFPDAVRRREMDFYLKSQNAYGLPLDNRDVYTKLDWILWTATLTQDRKDFDALVGPVYRFLNESPDRSPMTDWYKSDNGRKVGFTARPVVGGVFLQMLYNEKLWRKYAGRDQTQAKNFAPMPAPPKITTVAPAADVQPVTWRFTTEEPAAGWEEAEFDAGAWRQGKAGFGSRQTPGARLGAEWTTREIWLRREFDLTEAPDVRRLQLYIYHDEDAQVYLNGVLAATCTGFNGQYETLPIREQALASLKPTRNTLAVHCEQTTGGQYIDVGLVTVEQIDGERTAERP